MVGQEITLSSQCRGPRSDPWLGTSIPHATIKDTARYNWGFPDSSVVKNPPVMQETPFQFQGGDDLLEKG